MTRSTIQQTHMENGDLKSRVKVEEHQDGFINHSNLDRFVYQNGVRNQSQQTSMKLTHDGDNKLNRRSSILSVDDIQCLQRIGQVIKPRTFSADPLSQARTSCFVGPKQEPVDGVAMEGPGFQDLFGAGSNDVNPSFSSGLINSVPLPAQMPRVPPGSCNSFPSRMPHNVCWEPPYYNSATDWGTSGESVLAQPSTATFHKSGYLPIAGLVTPISAPLPQIQSQHEPLFTNTQVNGADPQTQPGSWLTLLMAMASQWGSPSPPTEANTSPYITPDVVSEMPSSSPRTPVGATFNDRASRSLTMQQHSGPVTAVDFSEAPMPPGTYFPNNVSAIEASSPHTTIASAEPVHEAVPGLQLTPTASHFPFQTSSPQFRIPMPLPPSLQNVTPASLHAAASGSNWTRACPIVPKLEISSPQDLSTTPGAAGLNALPSASLIKSESVQPPFLPQPSAVSSNFNTLFPQVSHMGRLQFPRKRSPMTKELSEPAAVAWNHIQGGVRAINLDSKDKQKRMGAGGQTVTVEGDDTQHQQRRQRQEVGINQRKKWKLCRRFGMIHPDNEELIKSAGRQEKVIVANNQVDKERRKLLQRRYWQLGDVCKNADSEGNVEQKRRWMLVRTRLLQSLILWKKARYRARLLTHPLFPHLLKAHVDCIRVMTPACKSRVITMQLQGSQRFFEKFLRFAPICPDEDKRRLDVHLKTFLLQMKKFQDHLECQLKFHAIPTYSRLWRIEQALFQMTGTRIPRGLESGPTMTEELEEGGSGVDSANIIRAATARVDYANIKRVIDARYCGAHKPTAPDRAIMETIRAEIVDSIGLAHYRRKIREVREEIMKKRSASKLPEGTTEILKEWWEAHSKRPYPTEHEKELLVKQTGLELKQVNNWFINQRKRNWHDNPLATNNRDKRKYPQAERKQA